MIFQTVGIGFFIALLVTLPKIIQSELPSFFLYSSILILSVSVIALTLKRIFLKDQLYDSSYMGLSDLLTYIHFPLKQDSPIRWLIRGFVSFLLCLIGGVSGPEGAGIEIVQAIQAKIHFFSDRWFEQKRRTYVATLMAAAVAAAFRSPFAAIILPLELGLGGRSLSIVLSALVSFSMARFLEGQFSLESIQVQGILTQFYSLDWHQWIGVVIIGILGGVLGGAIILFVQYSRASLLALVHLRPWMKVLVGGILLALVFSLNRSIVGSSEQLLEGALWAKYSPHQISLTFFVRILSFTLLLAGFGSMGWLWPLFTLGGLFGCCLFYWSSSPILNFGPIAGLSGAVALWGAVLNAPLSGAVLVYELTQNVQFLLPALVAGFLGAKVRGALKIQPLIEENLKSRGHSLHLGRSVELFDALSIKNVMVTNSISINEFEMVVEVQTRIQNSLYPFFPVVGRGGKYLGLLTADQLKSQGSSVEKMLEAKDLVYKNGLKTPTVQISDRLVSVIHHLDEFPCLPVLGGEGQLVGLLFGFQVRLAYEREGARRSFNFVSKDKNE